MADTGLPNSAEQCREIAQTLGLAIPDACLDAVLANLAVLERHLAILDEVGAERPA